MTPIPLAGFEHFVLPQVTFLQGTSLGAKAIVPEEPLPPRFDDHYDPRFVDIETGFSAFYPAITAAGGVTLGVGFLQTVNLAAVSDASGLVFVNFDPAIGLTLPLILPLLAEAPTARDWEQRVRRLFSPQRKASEFTAAIPFPYRPAFEGHIEIMRDFFRAKIETPIKKGFEDPEGFLANDALYQRIRSLAARGAIAVIYEDVFGEAMPRLMEAVLGSMPDGIRTLYLSNALSWIGDETDKAAFVAERMGRLPGVDGNTRLLTTRSNGAAWSFHVDTPFGALPLAPEPVPLDGDVAV